MTTRGTELTLVLPPRRRPGSAWRWLYDALRAEILAGRLRGGTRLPATRDLARQYGLARGTIVTAFEHLEAEGYVEGRRGSGTYVSRVLPEAMLEAVPAVRPGQAPTVRTVPPTGVLRPALTPFARRAVPLLVMETTRVRAFRANQPALDLFPMAQWTQVTARRLRRASTRLLEGCEALGYGPLREAVADYLRASRGVACSARQVVIVSGTQEALDLVMRVLLGPEDCVYTEDPGYVGAARLFDAYGARVIAGRIDDEGLRPPRSRQPIRLAYVTPAHQFPLGLSMSLARRLALLTWARQAGATIFEDDYDSEYRYAGRPLPALQGLDAHGSVIFAGSFSKTLFPALRLGYLVLPEALVEPVAAVKSITTRHAPVIDQAVLCDFITEGHFGRHVRRMRQVYAERLSILLTAAAEHLSGVLDIQGVEAGLQTVGWLPRGVDGRAVRHAAAARDVQVVPLSRYALRRLDRDGLQLGFAAIEPREIRRGIRELAAAIPGVSGSG